jgi:RNA recognition motif-containing protein
MKLYIGNLCPEVDARSIHRLLAPFGKVREAEVVLDAKTRRSRGFAFAILEPEDDARTAVKNLHGRVLGGRDLVVREAHPKESGTSAYRSLH